MEGTGHRQGSPGSRDYMCKGTEAGKSVTCTGPKAGVADAE